MIADCFTYRVPLRSREGQIRAHALIDLVDLPLVDQWRWCLNSCGYPMRNFQRNRVVECVVMHRQILGLWRGDPQLVDHINRDKLDNRRSNLRLVDHQGNAENASPRQDSSSQYRGVCWDAESQRWRARIRLRGKLLQLGYFDDEDEAGAVAAAFRAAWMPHSEEALECPSLTAVGEVDG